VVATLRLIRNPEARILTALCVCAKVKKRLGMTKDEYKGNKLRTQQYLEIFSRENVLRSLIPTNSPIILDVGANMGQSIEEFSDIWPNSTIYSFEPLEECQQSLNDLKNKINPIGIHIFNCAVGSVTDFSGLPFYTHDISEGLTGTSSGLSGFNKMNVHSKDSINIQNLKGKSSEFESYVKLVNKERKVPCVRLDDWIRENCITKIDLLKIDTQGHEPYVLEGAGHHLERIKVIVTELMLYDLYSKSLSFSDIEYFLTPAGFKLFDISHISKNPMNGRTDWVDVIYVNKNL